MTETSFGPNEMEVILEGIHGLSKDDLAGLSLLATSWRRQADLEQMTKERYDTLVHGKTVEANALMPTLGLKERDKEEFARRERLFAFKNAEKRILEWAFSEFNTIDVSFTNPTELLES